MDKKTKKHLINKYLFYSKKFGATLTVYARTDKKAFEIVDMANLYNDAEWSKYDDKTKFKTQILIDEDPEELENEEYEIVLTELEKRKKLFMDTRA